MVLLWTECPCPLKIHMLRSQLPMWWYSEVEPLEELGLEEVMRVGHSMMGLVSLKWEIPGPAFSTVWAEWISEEGSYTTRLLRQPVLGLPASGIVKNKCLLLKPPSLWYCIFYIYSSQSWKNRLRSSHPIIPPGEGEARDVWCYCVLCFAISLGSSPDHRMACGPPSLSYSGRWVIGTGECVEGMHLRDRCTLCIYCPQWSTAFYPRERSQEKQERWCPYSFSNNLITSLPLITHESLLNIRILV